ncbi:MAG: hypothetical protein LBF16_13650 [Pseudomonadales bacterium]|jgi:hypothetical protein|nr:hypothetical protein [Pseudomonadales bacterium]
MLRHHPLTRIISLLLIVTLASCASYIAPGPKADLQALAPPTIQAGFDTAPSKPFPAGIAAARIQGAGYENYNTRRTGAVYGSGKYAVITTRELGEDAQFARIAMLPQVEGIIGLNRLLLPQTLNDLNDLRACAAQLHADLLFVYTFETKFLDNDSSVPLTVITLGLSPTRKITAMTTVSALLIDTRTGYLYSAYENTEREEVSSTSWGSQENADKARQQTELRAFVKLVDDVVAAWPQLLARYAVQ